MLCRVSYQFRINIETTLCGVRCQWGQKTSQSQENLTVFYSKNRLHRTVLLTPRRKLHCCENRKPVTSSLHRARLQSTPTVRKVVDQVGGQQSKDLLFMYFMYFYLTLLSTDTFLSGKGFGGNSLRVRISVEQFNDCKTN